MPTSKPQYSISYSSLGSPVNKQRGPALPALPRIVFKGMYYGKFSFHQGTFEATNPVQEKTKRQAKWTKTQRCVTVPDEACPPPFPPPPPAEHWAMGNRR